MLEPWNNESIQAPPVHTCESTALFVTDDLQYICKEATRILSNQSPLHKEGAVLSRMLYKFDKKFRNDLGYRSLKKVNSALRKYLSLNLLHIIEQFCATLPQTDSDSAYLPTRQMLEYCLVRIMTFAKLMVRICVCSKQAAVFYLDRVRRGESHWMSFMPYAVLSRIWSITSILINHSCSWYNRLYKYLEQLQHKGLPFLPDDYTLPVDLSEWLELKRLNEFGRYKWKEHKCLEIGKILDDNEDTDAFDIFKYVNEINEPANLEIETDCDLQSLSTLENVGSLHTIKTLQNVDQGEAISRESFQSLSLERKVQRLPKIFEEAQAKHSISCVTNSKMLKKFLILEEKYRNNGSEEALSGHLSFMQWQALKTTLLKLTNILGNKNTFKRKFQKIWKEKCLDYC